MPTANDLIVRGFRRGRILGKDQALAPDEAADALSDLNDFLDELWNDKLMVFHILSETFAFQAAKQSYTVGTGGDFNTTRPVKIVPGCRYVLNGIERQLSVLTDRKSWDEIPYKALQGPPQAVFMDEAYPLATLYAYPTPDQAYTFYMNSWARLQNIGALNTAISLPPGYNTLLVNGIAIRNCPEYGMEPPASVVRGFNQTKRLLQLVNYEMPILGFAGAVLPSSAGGGFILSGDTV